MPHKIIGFSPADNDFLSDYISAQLAFIQTIFPDIQTELSNENDDKLLRYCKTPDRFPCFMLLKNNIYKTHSHAKMSEKDFCLWVTSKLG